MAETESTDANTFIQFAHEPLKRKRAEAVCIPCHSKKIKCDITRRSQNEHDRCSNCETNDRHCQLRPSQRGKQAVEAEHTNYDSTQTNVTGQTTVDDATDTFNLTPVTHDTSRIDFQPQDSSTQNVDPSLGSVENLTGIATGRSHGQDVDAGYLHVYGPENQFDADMQELRAYLSPGRESSDNQPLDFSLQSTFLETYWEYCYCFSRLLRDILARGNTRFLMAITCWYCGTAFIALLQGSRIPQFATDAEDGINVLTTLVEQLQKMWPSANVIRQGFDRLRRDTPAGAINANQLGLVVPSHLPPLSEGPARTNVETDATSASLSQHDSNWTELLPFVTRSTNSIAECLIDSLQQGNVTRGMPSPANVSFYENVMHEYDDFLAPFVLDQDLFDTPGLSGYPL
ncbi:hypothetical protein MBLNU230_g4810t1 [Neophaeotheca triangularis]